jgi:hypothetical protein
MRCGTGGCGSKQERIVLLHKIVVPVVTVVAIIVHPLRGVNV